MKKSNAFLVSALLIVGIIFGILYTVMPRSAVENNASLTDFSTQRAMEHVKYIAQEPHYAGSETHKKVSDYLEKELQKLGLQTQIQEGYSLTEWGNITKSKNILARIHGSGSAKALLLLSHYDSAPHSASPGASDDASGVATILESVRAFLASNPAHKNDIIILFSDAEELGLNGAGLFNTEHVWAKDVGLVLNLEARGTAGPSYMLMETNAGNAAMVKEFTAAKPRYPVSNSLMYSIYKMLPNDTDLTVFREKSKVQGFNFAFIDDHYNYHTQQDNIENLSQTSLAHQGTYILPLLKHFSNVNLETLDSQHDYAYFNTPFYFVSYPFSWNWIFFGSLSGLFLFTVFIGIAKRALNFSEIGQGFVPLFLSLAVSSVATFFGWKALTEFYPQYDEIQQGFTYNGHSYIGFFVFLSLAISFGFYKKCYLENQAMNFAIAPIFVWILLNLGLVLYLPGGGFFMIPVFCSVIVLLYFVITQKTNWIFNLILSIPALIILMPFITMLPVGLGLRFLVGSIALTVLLFSLLLPIFGYFSYKKSWSVLMALIAVGFFVEAHMDSNYQQGKAKPNSLLYVYDANEEKALWATYDKNLDSWTKNYLGENPNNADALNEFKLFSKYNSAFTFTAPADVKNLDKPQITFTRDTIIGNQRHLKIVIAPQRKVNRYDIFANQNIAFHNMKVNGVKHIDQKGSLFKRNGGKILSYYVVDNAPLEMQFSISKNTVLDMKLFESSFDLLSNTRFSVPKRESWMMPMPFVLTDAVVIRQSIEPSDRQPEIIIPEIDSTAVPTQILSNEN